ncbi:MAG: OapB/ArvB family protein [Nanoarchaeota archaeon]
MLTLQYIPHHEIENLDSNKRIKKLLKNVKENKILLVEGRLKREEETELIKRTMEDIDDSFKGIELGVIHPNKTNLPFFNKMKRVFIDFLLGDRQGLTIIGPATVVKEIKQDPDKIQLLTSNIEEAQVGLDKKK